VRHLPLWLLASCHRTLPDDTGPALHTGWFTDTAPEAETGCTDFVVTTSPAEGATDVYWRSALDVTTTTLEEAAYDAHLYGALDAEIAVARAASPAGFLLTPSSPLSPLTLHRLELSDCAGVSTVTFTTDAYGTPLEDLGTVVDQTWLIDLGAATWVQPAGFGTVLALYFTTPVLLGVEWADARLVDLVGAQGLRTVDGVLLQNESEPTWDYPAASFLEAPYFSASASQISIEFDGVSVDIHDFAVSATFAADGSELGGGRVTGLGDTRNMGPLLGSGDDPNALCELAASVGVTCQSCPDGLPYCLDMEAVDVGGAHVPGLTLHRVD
jgi:hypothetical protein